MLISIFTFPETLFVDSHYKSVKTENETCCWNQCRNELACNSISFYNGDSKKLYYGDNCLLFTNNSPETIKTKTFVSKMRRPKSKYNFCSFQQNLINIS